MAQAPFRGSISTFGKEFDKLTPKLLNELKRALKGSSPSGAKVIVKRVFEKYNVDAKLRDAISEGVVKSVSSGVKDSALLESKASIKKWFNSRINTNGVKSFGKQVNDAIKKDEIAVSITKTLNVNKSLKNATQRLYTSGIESSVGVAKDVQEVLRYARQVAMDANDPELYRQYRSQVKRLQSRIQNLKDPSTSKLKAAYQDIVNLTDKASAKAVDRALDNAIRVKAANNAERVAATEMARAYGDTVYTEAAQNEDVIGVRSVLSSAHDKYDICDFYADADLYGMGEGIFPYDNAPPYPYHPNCTCILELVYEGEAHDTGKFDSKNAEKFLGSLPAEKQQSLFGKRGSEDFNADTATWHNQLNNYQAPEPKGVVVPTKIKS